MPVIARIPVTSKLLFQKYMTRLISRMIPVCGVTTRITLEKAVNKTGQPYAQYIFGAADTLSPEETASAKAFAQKLLEIVTVSDEPDMPDIVVDGE